MHKAAVRITSTRLLLLLLSISRQLHPQLLPATHRLPHHASSILRSVSIKPIPATTTGHTSKHGTVPRPHQAGVDVRRRRCHESLQHELCVHGRHGHSARAPIPELDRGSRKYFKIRTCIASKTHRCRPLVSLAHISLSSQSNYRRLTA